MSADRSTSAALQLIAAVALGAPPPSVRRAADGVDTATFLDVARNHQLVGPALDAIAVGHVSVPTASIEHAIELHAAQLHRCLVIEKLLFEVSDVLGEAGITPIVLKGVATAHLDHVDPGYRVFEDVDLLVGGDDIDAAVTALEALGFRRDLPPRTSSWDRRFTKDLTLLAPSGPECDLHRTLVPGAFGFWLDVEPLRNATRPIEIAGRLFVALDDTARLLHAAYALTVGEERPRFVHALDFALMARRHADLDQVVACAEDHRAALVLGEATRLVESWIDWPLPPDDPLHGSLARLGGIGSDRWIERAVRRTYRSAGGTNTATLLAATAAIPGVRARGAYLRGLVRPDARYRRARRSSARPDEWRTGVRELLTGWRR